ncbi:MAG: mechanosensitive ion channel family protein [Eubacteriales bacterium]
MFTALSTANLEWEELPLPSDESLFRVFIILLIAAFGIPILLKMCGKILDKSKSLCKIQSYILSTIRIFLWSFVALMAADSFGIPVNSIFGLLGVVGIALSLALQNTLSNFAGGLQVLVSQPFQVGDYIDTDQGSGTVTEIGLAYSKLTTVDSKEILVPNALMSSSKIINYTASGLRRVDMFFPTSYDAPTQRVRESILEVVATLEKIHKDPEPVVYLYEFGDSAIVHTLRVWTDTADYWETYFALQEGVRESFARHDIEIPFNQMVVHLPSKEAQQ